MQLTNIDFSAFPSEREQGLKNIQRYSLFGTMFYRSSLWQHVHRVHWIVEELIPLCEKCIALDGEKARALALVHDDAELLTGDIQAGHKAKMTKEELAALEENEEKASRELAARYPREINGQGYEELLVHAVRKDCIEAQLVSYADRFDAYCETFHEILAGNFSLLWSLMLYERWLPTYTTKFPALKPLVEIQSPFVITGDNRFQPSHITVGPYLHFGKPHTAESLLQPTEFGFYDAWRDMVVHRAGEEGKRWLLEQKEFLPSA